ncbi:hypothetical protein ES708_29663 [subsurface metagenome]
MREYTFLLSKSFRSKHVKANTLREAWRLTKQWYKALSPESKERAGSLTRSYQDCQEGDYVMSGWKQTLDKRITI